MTTFVAGGAANTPFGVNEFLRSTKDIKRESYMVAASTVLSRTIDGVAGQKILQRGVVLAKITSGPDAGKVGPYSTDAAVTDGRSTAANIVGINDTFLPWQLMERDVEVAAVYEASVVQAWCLMMTLAGGAVPVAVDNATATAMQRGGAAGKGVDINFK